MTAAEFQIGVSEMVTACIFNVERLAKFTDQLNIDLVVAATRENLRYFTGFLPVIKTLNPYRGECYAILRKDDLNVVSVVHSAGEADQLLDMKSDLADAWIYGKFHRRSGVGGNLNNEEKFLKKMGAPVALTAIQALISAIEEYCGTVRRCRILVDDDDLLQRHMDAIKAALPNVTFVMGSDILREVRRIKTPHEIELLTRAARQNESAIKDCLSRTNYGTSEVDIARYFEESLVSRGGGVGVTMTKVGRNSVTGQRRPKQENRVSSGDIIWFDSDTTFDGYWADIARCAVLGQPSTKISNMYAALRQGMIDGLSAIKPGVAASNVFDIVVNSVKKAGIADYERHHVGHGIGLEPYEAPILMPDETLVLEEGMVISLETPLYEYGLGALHIEDPVLVTAQGARFLTDDPIPHITIIDGAE